jgi:hypothetical protein
MGPNLIVERPLSQATNFSLGSKAHAPTDQEKIAPEKSGAISFQRV